MSLFLRCFKKKESYELDEGSGPKERSKTVSKCKCRCKCYKNLKEPSKMKEGDEMDGKKFSKTLNINDKSKTTLSSCCEADSEASPSSTGRLEEEYTKGSSLKVPLEGDGQPHYFLQYESHYINSAEYLPVSKNNPYYNMDHGRRGRAIIFNFDRWDNTTIKNLELSPRLGSEKDKKDLAACLRRLSFEVEEYDNIGTQGLYAVLDRVRDEDHTDADCLVVAVMTHGEKNTVYMRDGTQIPINLIWEHFEAHSSPTLAGKPKIFIVQACRGKQYDNGTRMQPRSRNPSGTPSSMNDVTDASTFSYVIPNAADILVAFSCPLGHYSWRHPERGSWFIQAICKVFNESAYTMDLQGLFTTVAREVALNYISNTTNIDSNNKKQVTSTSSTLIRTVLFKPKMSCGEERLEVPVDHSTYFGNIVDKASSDEEKAPPPYIPLTLFPPEKEEVAGDEVTAQVTLATITINGEAGTEEENKMAQNETMERKIIQLI